MKKPLVSHTEFEPDYLHSLIDEDVAAKFLGYSSRALQNWRTRGGGPPYIKVSARSIRYRRRELMAWSESRLKSHSSEINTS